MPGEVQAQGAQEGVDILLADQSQHEVADIVFLKKIGNCDLRYVSKILRYILRQNTRARFRYVFFICIVLHDKYILIIQKTLYKTCSKKKNSFPAPLPKLFAFSMGHPEYSLDLRISNFLVVIFQDVKFLKKIAS